MADKWKVVRRTRDIVNPGIYQEKFIIICHDVSMVEPLRAAAKKTHPDAEECEVPADVLKMYPQSFGYWINKHDPKCSMKDIRQGNIRIKIQ